MTEIKRSGEKQVRPQNLRETRFTEYLQVNTSLNKKTKLRQLGPPNQIVDDWKSDSNEFGQRLYNNSDSNVKIVSISFRLILT